ncbi:MAG: hypothetical protein NC489_35900 [Ruminococcus flavefaciens]|nr:hypothetical protein [Ruminococcus flavefaciens]
MDEFLMYINNVNNSDIDEFCKLNLSEKINDIGGLLFANYAERVLNAIFNLFGSSQLDNNNKLRLADFLIKSIDNDDRLETIMWNQIYIYFNVQGIGVGVVQNDILLGIVKYFLMKIDIPQQNEVFWVKIYILAYIYQKTDAKDLLEKNQKRLTSYQEEKFVFLYNAINFTPTTLKVDQLDIESILLAISGESKLTPTFQPVSNFMISIKGLYNLKAIQKKTGIVNQWENLLDFMVLNRYITIRNQKIYNITRNFGNISTNLFPDDEVLYYVMVIDDIVNHNGDALVVLNTLGIEYVTYSILPRKMEEYLQKQKENSDSLKQEQEEMKLLKQQLDESKREVDKMSEQLEKSTPSLITIISLIVAIIPFVVTNMNFIGTGANGSLVMTVNGCLLLVITIIYAFVNYIILDRNINKKVWIFLIGFVIAIILVA